MEDSVKEKTGKEMKEWFAILKKTGLDKHKAMLNHLKDDFGISYGYANLIALKFRKGDAGSHDESDLIAQQYKAKPELLPIYQSMDNYLRSLGKDVKVTPKKAAVSYIRKNQFALVKPATKNRIDLGLKIKDQEPDGRLEGSGPFGSMCTHRIQINTSGEFDDLVKDWIRKAYDGSV